MWVNSEKWLNELRCGDNIEVFKSIPTESVDLIYIDPPFFSNRHYEVIWGNGAELRSFGDRWKGGIDHYISWMVDRLKELNRILKPSGSIYVHLDHHAVHYLKVELDKIFGYENFRNEIIWKKLTAAKAQSTTFTKSNDSILFYTKSNNFSFNKLYKVHDEKYLDQFYKYKEADGRRFTLSDFTQLGRGPKRFFGKEHGWLMPPDGKHWIWSQNKIDDALRQGLLYFSKNGNPRIKRYLDQNKGMPVDNIWTDIFGIQGISDESIGYPTQKPEALLERIIKASSNEGDIILDAFCGCGTTIAVAERLNRKWIGIDVSPIAVKVMTERLIEMEKKSGKKLEDFITFGLPEKTVAHLRKMDWRDVEDFVIQQIGGKPHKASKTNDDGIDGFTKEGTPIQIKRWQQNVGEPDVFKFEGQIRKAKSNKGKIFAFSFSKDAHGEVARAKRENGVEVELVTMQEFLIEKYGDHAHHEEGVMHEQQSKSPKTHTRQVRQKTVELIKAKRPTHAKSSTGTKSRKRQMR